MAIFPSKLFASCGGAMLVVIGLAGSIAQVASAQTVQLPTTRIFSGGGSVLVPDQGSASLGGISRSSSGSTTRGFGPIRNRGTSSSSVTQGTSVTARVIDFDEMERELFGDLDKSDPIASEDPATAKIRTKADSIARGVARDAAPIASRKGSGSLESLSSLKAQAAAEEKAHLEEVKQTFARAEEATSQKKWGVARVHYKSLIRNEKGQVAQLAKQRLAEMESLAAESAGKGTRSTSTKPSALPSKTAREF